VIGQNFHLGLTIIVREFHRVKMCFRVQEASYMFNRSQRTVGRQIYMAKAASKKLNRKITSKGVKTWLHIRREAYGLNHRCSPCYPENSETCVSPTIVSGATSCPPFERAEDTDFTR
jgi:hypothetical protein